MGEGVEAMANELRLSRRTFIAWVGGASAGFYLFGRLPGMSAPVALAAIPGRIPRSVVGTEVPDTAAHPAGDAEGGHSRSAGSDDRLLRDLDEAVRAADPARGPTRNDGLGLRCREVGEPERLAPPQRAVAHDRSAGKPASAGEVDQRSCGRERGLPAASAPGRPDPALGEPARTACRDRDDAAHVRRRRPARTRGPCRWSPTSTAR